MYDLALSLARRDISMLNCPRSDLVRDIPITVASHCPNIFPLYQWQSASIQHCDQRFVVEAFQTRFKENAACGTSD